MLVLGFVQSVRLGLFGREASAAQVAQQAAEAPSGDCGHDVTLRVLVAEDNRTNRLVFSKMVKDLHIDLQFAENGRLAVEAVQDFKPDLVFMDISMPEMDGKEATRTIRKREVDETLPHTPIVALTAHAMEGDKQRSLDAGMNDHLTKPVDPNELSRQELQALTRRYAIEIGPFIGPTSDIPAPDIGTDRQTMAWFMDTYSQINGYAAHGVVTGKPISIGLLGNAAEVFPDLLAKGIIPDVVTDQTSAHDPLNGYLPVGWSMEQAAAQRGSDEAGVVKAAKQSMALQVKAMLGFQQAGAATLDYGNNIRQMALEEGVEHAFDFPGFVPAYIRPLFCQGIGPFRWAALSGDPEDIYKTDAKVKELIPDNPHLHNWLDMAKERIQFQGLPARICWVGLGERQKLGLAFNQMVREGVLSAPVVIGRDHLDSGSVASPNRETEAMMDGSDAVSDWPLLNALLNTAGGATWVSLHHGGGVGMGFSQHSGVVIVCDGSKEADERIARVLHNDPATGVMRHADAGYDIAKECAQKHNLDLPMINAETGKE